MSSSPSPASSSSDKSSVQEPSQVFGLIVLAVAFLWIAISGSSRVLKVLDRRVYLLGRSVPSFGGGGVLSVGPGNLHPSAMATPRHSTMGGGGSIGGLGAGVYSSALTDSLWSDNRFVFGLCAVCVGLVRATYLFLVLMLDSASRNHNQHPSTSGNSTSSRESISGDNLTSDTVLAPAAWLFYSLLAAILWALRDLLVRVRSSISGMTSSNLSTPGLSPQRLGNIAQSSQHSGGDAATVTSEGSSMSPTSGGGSPGRPDGALIGSNTPSAWSKLAEKIRPFSAVATSLAILCAIVISLIAAWVHKKASGSESDDAANKTALLIPAVTSSIISFLLMFWSISSTVQAVSLLRSVGIAAHRVVLAFAVMALFLSLRGILILPPVQEALCGNSATADSFWACTFLYDLVDAAGTAIILALLP